MHKRLLTRISVVQDGSLLICQCQCHVLTTMSYRVLHAEQSRRAEHDISLCIMSAGDADLLAWQD